MSSGSISLVISILSITLSAGTFWWNVLRRGALKATRPSIVFFGYDGSTAKVFVRSLLYSTGARGQLVEHMWVRIRKPDPEQLFTFWGYGERNALMPGSGLFVSPTGIALNHHFVQSAHDPKYIFGEGRYEIEIMAKVVSQSRPIRLSLVELDVTEEQPFAILARNGILFERDPVRGTFKGQAGPDPTNDSALDNDRVASDVASDIGMFEWLRGRRKDRS